VLVIVSGLAALVVSVWLNVRIAARWSPKLAVFNVATSMGLVFILAMKAVTWADVQLDDGPSRRIEAKVVEQAYRASHGARYTSNVTHFAGLDISSADPAVGDTLLKKSALPQGRALPVPGDVVTMNVHPGWLGIPWVDEVEWSR
jgi:hypothetical protein